MTADPAHRRSLLLEIARCSEIERCIANKNHQSPCGKVVRFQDSGALAKHQVAEPWSGALATAPILFVSSNPAISDIDVYPLWETPDDLLVTYFEDRFQGFVRDGKYALKLDGEYDKVQRFWSGVLSMAGDLLDRPAVPGVDYALTELVHCKSSSEKSGGVQEAVTSCGDRYFTRILAHASARLVVVLGDVARDAIRSMFELPAGVLVGAGILPGSHPRVFLFLGHPTGPKERKPEKVLTTEQLSFVRQLLAA